MQPFVWLVYSSSTLPNLLSRDSSLPMNTLLILVLPILCLMSVCLAESLASQHALLSISRLWHRRPTILLSSTPASLSLPGWPSFCPNPLSLSPCCLLPPVSYSYVCLGLCLSRGEGRYLSPLPCDLIPPSARRERWKGVGEGTEVPWN